MFKDQRCVVGLWRMFIDQYCVGGPAVDVYRSVVSWWACCDVWPVAVFIDQ